MIETPVADPALLDTLRSMGVDFTEVRDNDVTVAVRVTEDVYNDLVARAEGRAS